MLAEVKHAIEGLLRCQHDESVLQAKLDQARRVVRTAAQGVADLLFEIPGPDARVIEVPRVYENEPGTWVIAARVERTTDLDGMEIHQLTICYADQEINLQVNKP